MDRINKQAFRKTMRTARKAMSEAERNTIDRAIAARVIASPEFTQAKALFTYLSVGEEVDTRAIITAALDASKLVALPRVVPGTRDMTWHATASLDGLERSSFGIEEPPASFDQIDPFTCFFEKDCNVPEQAFSTHAQDNHAQDSRDQASSTPTRSFRALALVPGLAFDRRGNRIGYGGGFYDTFLEKFPGPSFGLCRTRSLVDDLNDIIPLESHDLPVTRVITEH